jgi:hypothetical protein
LMVWSSASAPGNVWAKAAAVSQTHQKSFMHP